MELLRAEEVAEKLRISRAKAYQMMAAGELPTIKIGSRVRVPADRLQAWLDANVREAVAS